jgi:HAD superfamily hydrolase (TIGR01509 family)
MIRTNASAYRAILWDNDGVLVDTERWYHRATREILADVGIDVTEELYRNHFLIQSGGISELGQLHGLSEACVVELRRRRDARYTEFLSTQTLTISGVEETLAALRPHFKMGIVTSSRRDHFEAMHRRTGLLRFFDFSLAQGEYPATKPAPDSYLAGIARVGHPAAQCVAIEDAPRGLVAARAAGLDCWVVETDLNRGASLAQATRILNNIPEMVGLLMTGG